MRDNYYTYRSNLAKANKLNKPGKNWGVLYTLNEHPCYRKEIVNDPYVQHEDEIIWTSDIETNSITDQEMNVSRESKGN
jgi:hypothetical protein